MSIPYVTEHDPCYGEALQVAPLVRRVTARNAGRFSGWGTGTYIVGRGEVVVIDPGPTLNSHRDALSAAIEGERVSKILVTHCHSDHSPLAAWLKELTGAPTVCFGPHVLNADWVDDDTDPYEMDDDDKAAKAAAEADGATEEGHDLDFRPDIVVADGDIAAEGDGWTISAVHTPGHTSNHTCYHLAQQRLLFSGDHIMGWSTSVITPPDGDMRHYLASLEKVRALAPAALYPTHGSPASASSIGCWAVAWCPGRSHCWVASRASARAPCCCSCSRSGRNVRCTSAPKKAPNKCACAPSGWARYAPSCGCCPKHRYPASWPPSTR